ncbi:MAG: hypothetical protein AAF525_06550 [Pseudomonadota bacterium]
MKPRFRLPLIRLVTFWIIAQLTPHFAVAEIYGSGWYGELQLSAGHEDNLSRSYKDEDLLDETSATITIGGGYATKIGQRMQLISGAYVGYTDRQNVSVLSNTAVSLGSELIYQPSNAYDAPWYIASLDVTRLEFEDSDARDGYVFSGDLGMARRLTMRSTARIGYRYSDFVFVGKDVADERRHAAFDTAYHELYVSADMRLASNLGLIVAYSRRHGGFTSSVSGSPDPNAGYEAETADHAFETCVNNRCDPWYAYRAVADTDIIDVGLVFAMAGATFDVSIRHLTADAAPQRYDNTLVQIGTIWNF